MIYHICPHFDLFIKITISRFDTIKAGTSCCLELSAGSSTETRMRTSDHEGFTVYSYDIGDPRWREILLKDCTGIFLHNLQTYMLKPLLDLPENIPFYFRSYGGDIFDLIYDDDRNFYMTRTSQIIREIKPVKERLSGLLNSIYCKVIPHKRNWEKTRDQKIKLLEKTFAVSPTCPQEFEMLQQRWPDLSLKYLPFGYFPLSEEEYSDRGIERENIIIGHSNSPGQNHVDAFEFIKDYKCKEKIIVPLSYKKSRYSDAVIREGRKILGDRFYPLITFLPKNEYYDILSSSYAFIEFSVYQQGLANIVFMMKQGANVYLPERNPIYIFFVENGITVFSVERDLSEYHLKTRRITEAERKKNNDILTRFYSSDIDRATAEVIVERFS